MALTRYFSLGLESAFASAVAASRYVEAPVKLVPDQGFIIPTPVVDRSRAKICKGPFRTIGNVGPFDVTADNIGELIHAIMGPAGYSYTDYSLAEVFVSRLHQWTSTNVLSSHTLRIGAEIEERILAGMLANKLSFKSAHGEDLVATCEWVGPGADESTGSLATVTRANLTQLRPFAYHEASGFLSVGGGDRSAVIYDFELDIQSNIPYQRGAMSSRFMPKARYGSRSVTGKFSAFFDDDAEYERFISGEPFALDLKFRGDLIGIADSPDAGNRFYEIRWLMPKCVYLSDSSHSVARQDEPLIVDCPFQALYDPDDSELLITLENKESIDYTGGEVLDCEDVLACLEGRVEGDYASWTELWEWSFPEGLNGEYVTAVFNGDHFFIAYLDDSNKKRIVTIAIATGTDVFASPTDVNYFKVSYVNDYQHLSYNGLVVIDGNSLTLSTGGKYVIIGRLDEDLNLVTTIEVWSAGVKLWTSPVASDAVSGATRYMYCAIRHDGKYIIALTDNDKLVCFEGVEA